MLLCSATRVAGPLVAVAIAIAGCHSESDPTVVDAASAVDEGSADPTTGEPCTPSTVYADVDGDGHGDPLRPTPGCGDAPAPGFAATDDDCDDRSPYSFDGHPELCDGLDNDCDGTVDAVGLCPAGCVVVERATSTTSTPTRYLACRELHTWDEARSICRAHGFDLAHIGDRDELNFVAGSVAWAAFVGGRSVPPTDPTLARSWRWVDDGTEFSRTAVSGLTYGLRGSDVLVFGNADGCARVEQFSTSVLRQSSCESLEEFLCERN
jgi:hypothetical protein